MPDGKLKRSVRLEFKDISYEIKKSSGIPCKRTTESKLILEGLSGVVEPGDLVALIGASGAGKSTLLNVLSRRIISNDGSVFLNGVDASKSNVLENSACFIQQEDLFYGFITVSEHLNQQANFRIALPVEEKQKRVQDVMDRFSLNKSRNSRIGNVAQGASRGISGGEKKRLSVATELLINPALIFADEPTSGLDAFMAESVVEVLKQLADSGHTVISTIHQPSSDVFAMFNKVLLLSEGRMVYFGPRLGAIPYFLRLGHPCPPYTNPSDFLIELLAIDWENPTEKLSQIQKWVDHWDSHGAAFINEWETELKEKFTTALNSASNIGSPIELLGATSNALTGGQINKDMELFELPVDKDGHAKHVAKLLTVKTILRRNITSTARNPALVRARLIQVFMTALLGGFVYFRLDTSSYYSKAGACFFMLVNQGFMNVFAAISGFMGDKVIVLRERDAGLFSLTTYFFAKIFSDFIFQFYLPLIYATICWYMMGLNDAFWRFLVGACYLFCMAMSCTSLGYIVASFAPNMGVAVALGPVMILPFLMVSGFVIQKASLGAFWIWLYYLSPFVYGFSGLMRCVFLDMTYSDFNMTGNQILDGFEVETSTERWFYDFLGLFIWIFGGRALAWLLFILSNRKKTK